jgi:hypothetical protein
MYDFHGDVMWSLLEKENLENAREGLLLFSSSSKLRFYLIAFMYDTVDKMSQ